MSVFDRFDANHDGYISRAEFSQALHDTGKSQSSYTSALPSRTLPHFPLSQSAGASLPQVRQAAAPGAPLPRSYTVGVGSPGVSPPSGRHTLQEPVVHASSLPQHGSLSGAAISSHSVPIQAHSAGISAHYATIQPAVHHAEVIPSVPAAGGMSRTSHSLASSAVVSPYGHSSLSTAITPLTAPFGGGLASRLPPRLDRLGPGERVAAERPISREELASTGNLIEGPALGAQARPAMSLANPYGTLASPGPSATMFDRLDQNHDGVISRDEFFQGTRLGAAPVAII